MPWRVSSASRRDGIARGFHAPAFDDSAWPLVTAPFEFQLHSLPGRAWFRGSLDRPHVITGCDARAVLFVDGIEAARLEGPYDAATAQGAIALYIEEEPERGDWVTSLSRWATHNDIYGWKRTVRGVHGNWDCKRPGLSSAGWWRAPRPVPDVRVFSRGDTLIVQGGDLDVRVNGETHRGHGELRVRLRAPRWSTWDRGGPAFLAVDVNGVRHDVAFRTIEMRTTPGWRDLVADLIGYLDTIVLHRGLPRPDHSPDLWRLRLNGDDLFLRGTNYVSDLHPELIRDPERDVALLREANLNFVRVHGHVEPPEFHRACSKAGILVMQDLPLQWGYDPSVRPAAVRMTRAIVEELRDEPCLAVWNVHNEPMPWDMLALDRLLVGLVRRLDPGKPVIAGCGYPGVTMHAYAGWYFGQVSDLRFASPACVTEVGAQAVGADGSLDCAQPEILRKYLGDWRDTDDLRERSQQYQAAVLQIGIEHFRRLKPECRAIASFMFTDGNLATTWSVLDHARIPKPGYRATRLSMQPILASLERYGWRAKAGDTVGGRVFLVNDSGAPRDVSVTVRCNGDARTFRATAPPDRSLPIGEAWFPVRDGRTVVELEVRDGDTLLSHNEAAWEEEK